MSQCRTDAARRLARGRGTVTFAGLLVTLSALAGCSTGQIDAIPKEFGGLPQEAPRRADNPPAYPAVHDVPPTRDRALMDEGQQKRLEADLVAARTRLQNQQKKLSKAAPKQAAADGAAQSVHRPTVKRGRRPTALTDDNPGRGRPSAARQAPAAQANPRPVDNAPAWPAPPTPDATGFGRNP